MVKEETKEVCSQKAWLPPARSFPCWSWPRGQWVPLSHVQCGDRGVRREGKGEGKRHPSVSSWKAGAVISRQGSHFQAGERVLRPSIGGHARVRPCPPHMYPAGCFLTIRFPPPPFPQHVFNENSKPVKLGFKVNTCVPST